VKAEVRIAQGETAGKICRGAGISEQTYYKWRREYGGLKIDQAKRLGAHGPPEHIRSDNVLRQEVGCPEWQQVSVR